MAAEPWQFRFIDGWEVRRPTGEGLRLSSRKARALLTMLVLNRAPLSKKELASQLWPEHSPAKQSQSLRRAVSDIRAAAAPDLLIDSRQATCALVPRDIWCDVLDAIDREESVEGEVLPDLPEPFFESFRIEVDSIGAFGPSHAATRGLIDLLDWIYTTDASRIIDVLHASRELLAYMPMPTLELVLNRGLAAAPDHPRRSWAHVQLAIAKIWQGATAEGLEHAKAVLTHVRPDENLAEWAQAVSAAATAFVFRGRFRRAEALLSTAINAAEQLHAPRTIESLKHWLCHCYGYAGRLTECRSLLSELDDSLIEGPYRALRNAHRAVYALLDGDLARAESHLQTALDELPADADFRLSCQVHIAESYVLLARGERKQAATLMADLLRGTDDYHLPLVEIHLREGLAFALEDAIARTEYARSAQLLREQQGLPMLPLDSIRFEMFR